METVFKALEAKEKLIQAENQTLASITYQNYFNFIQKYLAAQQLPLQSLKILKFIISL